jgi:hypothetical protein
MPNFSILLPPSDAKQSGGNPFAPDMFDYRTSNTFNYFNELNPERRKLIGRLQEVIEEGENLESVFGASDLEHAVRVNREIYNAPLMSALDRYSPGVLYKAMDFGGLPTGAQRRLLENGVIFSGLFGVLRPDDLIPEYWLPINLDIPGLGMLSDFWRPIISQVLNRTVADTLVWNLLPPVHQAAWSDDHRYETMVVVKFVREKGGERTAVNKDVEPLHGKLVNFIVRDALESIEPLAEWTHPDGYTLDPEATVTDEATRTVTVTLVKK